MSNYENIKTQFDSGVENVKNAIIGSIKSVLSKENVTIDISLKDEEASKASPSELKFPMYSIELSEQSHHQCQYYPGQEASSIHYAKYVLFQSKPLQKLLALIPSKRI